MDLLMILEMSIAHKPLCIILKKKHAVLQEANSIVGSVFHSIIPLSPRGVVVGVAARWTTEQKE